MPSASRSAASWASSFTMNMAPRLRQVSATRLPTAATASRSIRLSRNWTTSAPALIAAVSRSISTSRVKSVVGDEVQPGTASSGGAHPLVVPCSQPRQLPYLHSPCVPRMDQCASGGLFHLGDHQRCRQRPRSIRRPYRACRFCAIGHSRGTRHLRRGGTVPRIRHHSVESANGALAVARRRSPRRRTDAHP